MRNRSFTLVVKRKCPNMECRHKFTSIKRTMTTSAGTVF
jgi:hypothetical protein